MWRHLPVNNQLQQYNVGMLVEFMIPFNVVVLLQQGAQVQVAWQPVWELPGGTANRSRPGEDLKDGPLEVDQVFPETFNTISTP